MKERKKEFKKSEKKRSEEKSERDGGGGRDLSVQWRVCDPSKMEDTQTELF